MEISVTPESEAGVYANFVGVWHDADVFTLDFTAVTRPPEMTTDPETGEEFLRVQSRIVSRVRIPPGQVFEIMRALEVQLSGWESETGRTP